MLKVHTRTEKIILFLRGLIKLIHAKVR